MLLSLSLVFIEILFLTQRVLDLNHNKSVPGEIQEFTNSRITSNMASTIHRLIIIDYFDTIMHLTF
jgi:hypothetical protein